MADVRKLKRLKFHRNACLNEVQLVLSLGQRTDLDHTASNLFKVRAREIDNIKDEFLKNHNEIISYLLNDDDADLNTENTIRDGFLSEFFAIKSIYMELFESNQGSNLNVSRQSSTFNPVSQARLPKIVIPIFKGDFKAFGSFIDLYNALVHSHSSLSDIEKFNYLISSLEGPPLTLVRTLPMVDANYQIAYDTLVARYSNKRLRAQEHWQAIENTYSLSSNNNSFGLRKLLDIFSENLSALKNLGFPTNEWDFILVMMLLKRLDNDTVTKFELNHASNEIPKFKDLFDFLEKCCIAYNTLNLSTIKTPKNVRLPKPNNAHTFFLNDSNNKQKLFCTLCKQDHALYNCQSFVKKSPHDRFYFCRSKHICFNCLSNQHDIKTCKSIMTCRTCSQRHHTLLHFSKNPTSQNTGPLASSSEHSPALKDNHLQMSPLPLLVNCPSTQEGPLNDNNQSLSLFSKKSHPIASNSKTFVGTGMQPKCETVLLATAIVEALDNQGNYQHIRCLLDSGSMSSFITQGTVNRLGLHPTQGTFEIKGLDSMQSKFSKGTTNIIIRPMAKSNIIFHIDAIVLHKICDRLPSERLQVKDWTYIRDLNLADPNFFCPGKIDCLLGADIFSKILLDGSILASENRPDAIHTLFGYILMGKHTQNTPNISRSVSLLCHSVETQLESTIKSFWEIESVPSVTVLSLDDMNCEHHFSSTHARSPDGQYIVSLPFMEQNPIFSGIRDLAVNRFFSLERRLLKQPDLHAKYCEFMKEYLDLGHMKLISNPVIPVNSYYIPHHCVLRPDSPTTKLRVVFNGSAKLPNQHSLNDYLFTGPKLQPDILNVLLNFRVHKYVLCADIKQMYRMIQIQPNQQDYQRIVWRFSSQEPLKDYNLVTVVYGLRPSPFLALRTLRQLVYDEGTHFPLASKAILHQTFVDDITSGAPSFKEATLLKKELIALLKKGCFELRKWSSNDPSLLIDLPPDHLNQKPISFESEDPDACLKILGLQWSANKDCFLFSTSPLDRPCTKRHLLSELARCFDPIGFLAPVTFFTKVLIQNLWSLGLSWDQNPPESVIRSWTQYKRELPLLSKLEVPRRISSDSNNCTYELHGFSDASCKGYAAVAYIRCIHSNNSVTTHFLSSKTKVAPLKSITIPRLELCGSVLLSKLLHYILEVYKNTLKFTKVFAWCDSQIVLSWIRSSPHRWKTFVANRVAYIQDNISPSFWNYVESKSNPADIASRGLLPSELLNNSLWFYGPEFLHNNTDLCVDVQSTCSDNFDTEQFEEEKKVVFAMFSPVENFIDALIENYSSFYQIQRILAYVLRFINILKRSNQRYSGLLSIDELNCSLDHLVKRTQKLHFQEEFDSKKLSKPLRKLGVFSDENNILRVGGRLKYSSLSYNAKHPILLPRKSRFTMLLIKHYHETYLHAGLTTLHFLLVQRFWILCPKRTINTVLSKCLKCWKINPKTYQPPMGNLPVSRISQAKAFSHSGVDFGGPFQVTMGRYRGAKSYKAYICLFVCFATKAIHLELCTSLSSDSFLAAFQRFLARRGKITCIYSDCGTNFVGAAKEIKTLVESAASHENIKWCFNPPSAPHFGGLWEAGIKSVKSHLSRVIGDQNLTYEEFYTVLTLIESVLNSRPLAAFSSNIEDINALTPSHFLILEPVSLLPQPDLGAVPLGRLSRYQLLQRIHQDFWRRWHREYLHTLQQRGKWLKPEIVPEIGTLVVIKSENQPVCNWPLGRLTSITVGSDGVARVATVKTSNGTFLRPLVKLCPLPMPD